jgi:DNA repair protein RadA/Sms
VRAIVPKANAPKRAKIGDLEIIGVDRLSEALAATVA